MEFLDFIGGLLIFYVFTNLILPLIFPRIPFNWLFRKEEEKKIETEVVTIANDELEKVIDVVSEQKHDVEKAADDVIEKAEALKTDAERIAEKAKNLKL